LTNENKKEVSSGRKTQKPFQRQRRVELVHGSLPDFGHAVSVSGTALEPFNPAKPLRSLPRAR
jgi:hypothetical protein